MVRKAKKKARKKNLEPNSQSVIDDIELTSTTSIYDMPNEIMERIFEFLAPQDLCSVAQVCTSLRINSSSDYLWKKHVENKWSKLVGDVVQHLWQWHRRKIMNARSFFLYEDVMASCAGYSGIWPFVRIQSYLENHWPFINLIRNHSQKALYTCLETGCFWFPAQLYRNQTYLISYCDALLSYDSRTDSFRARSANGAWKKTTRVKRNLARLSPVDTLIRGYYNSVCHRELKPGDYIEIQTRPHDSVPYDCSFAEIGHLKSCDKDANNCSCKDSDTLVVEFKHLHEMSLHRKTLLNRHTYEEQNYLSRYFGGMKKLDNKEEIAKWKSFFSIHKFTP